MRLKSIVVVVILTVSSVYAQEGWYIGRPINTISFSGLRYIDPAELKTITDPYLDRIFTNELYAEILGKLYALDYFETINPSIEPFGVGSGLLIHFIVKESPTVSTIMFTGNKSIRNTELLGTILTKVNSVMSDRLLASDEAALIRKYREKGFPAVQVRSEVREDQNGRGIVTFAIDEGEKIVIGDFRFEGNQIFSDKTLRGTLSLKAKGFLNDGAFEESKLVADRQALQQYYWNRGYIDAKILDVQQEISKDSKGNNVLTIIFRIEEGRHYTFGGITFSGNEIFSHEELEKLVYSQIGQPINAQHLEADLQRIASKYYEGGYISTDFTRNENRDASRGIISYSIGINERDQGRAHIENIIIRGNTRVKEAVILREIPLEPGEVFSQTKLINGLRNLYNLQYFSNIIPDSQQGSTDNLLDLIFNVEEQQTINLQVGATFSGVSDPDTFPISGMIQWSDQNFLRSGNIAGATLNFSTDSQTASLNYTHRWLFGLPLSASVSFDFQHIERKTAMDNLAPFFNGDETGAYPDGFSSYEEYENNSFTPASAYLMTYNQWYSSLGLSTGYRFYTPGGNLVVNGGIRAGFIQNTFNGNLFRPFDPTLRAANNRWVPANSIWASVALDNRDTAYDPSRSYYFMTRFGLYGIIPNEAQYYTRSDIKAEWFHTFIERQLSENYTFKLTLGLHTGFSFIFPQLGRTLAIENTNKFAIDGMFNARGWNNVYHVKGLAYWENWAELRIPLVPGVLAFDFFFDFAGVHDTPASFFQNFPIIEQLRFSFGGGFRFTVPQLPLRLSFAKRFQIKDGAIVWQQGLLGKIGDNPATGIDFVLSFVIPSY
ncbi:MAG: outer membrane protein assembly factor BamA [Treponema sp.]|jgi:outer membrane protein insertion porin family|nr:outer membrane protein assembly factor BamA [Treponema sp.]